MTDSSWAQRLRATARGVRFRMTLFATATVGLVLLLGGVALIQTTQASQTASIQTTVETRAQDIATLIAEGTLSDLLPGRGEAIVAQVVTSDGTVIASSPDIVGEPPLVETLLSPGETFDVQVPEAASDPGQDGHADIDRVVVGGLGVNSPQGELTILVSGSLDPVSESIAALVPVLILILPIVLVVVAGVVWVLTGRALAPVEAIRSQAEDIGAEALDLRVPVPDSGDEIECLAVTMNEMLDRLDEAARTQRRFVADASHELRSPVAAIRTMLEVAQRHPDTVDAVPFIEDLLYEDTRLEMLTADLLTLARHDERALSMKAQPFDVCSLLAEEASSARSRSDRDVAIDADGSATVLGDRDRLSQALRNLIDNALRHSDRRVWLSCTTHDADVLITVSDDGPGVPVDKRESVFDRFVRLDDSRARTDGGSGLGLPVCRALVRAHGGTVSCVEPERGGATFKVQLPLSTK